MPVYEYQGQRYDIATDDHAAAKEKILNYLNTQPDELGRFKATTEQPQPQEGPVQVGEDAPDLTRGFKNTLGNLQQVYGGAKVLAGKAFDSQELMQSGLESMKTGASRTEVKPTDDLTEAWNKGIGSVVGDWLPYQIGSGAGNILETLGFMGIGAGAGALTGMGAGALPGAVTGALERGLISKGINIAAKKVLEETAEKELAAGATKEVAQTVAKEAAAKYVAEHAIENLSAIEAKAAASTAAKNIGGNLGIIGQAGLHGAGEVTQQAVQQAETEGRAPTDIDTSRVIPAAIVHGVADWFAEKIGLNALDGMAMNSSGKMITDIAKAIVLTGTKEAVPETVQEIAQRYGANLSLADADALTDYVNTIGASYAMSVAPAGIGGVRSNLAHRVQAPTQDQSVEDTTKTAVATKNATGPSLLDKNGKPIVASEQTQEELPQKQTKVDATTESATQYLSQIDAGAKPSFPKLQKFIKAFGLEIPESGPNRNQEAIDLLKGHLAQQGEQDVGATSTVNATDRSSVKVPRQRKATAVAAGITSTGTEGLAGVKPPAEVSQVGAGAERAALDEKTKTAFEQQAQETETVEQKSVEELEAQAKAKGNRPVKKEIPGIGTVVTDEQKIAKPIKATAKLTEEPSAQNYLNQNSYYGQTAPGTIEQGLENAGHDHAFDNFDSVAYEKEIQPILQQQVDALNQQQEAKRQAILNKEGRYSASTDAEAKTAANQIKDYSVEKPLEFMPLDDLVKLYRSKIGTSDFVADKKGGQARKDAAANREAFINSLDPLQRKKVEMVEDRSFKKEVEGPPEFKRSRRENILKQQQKTVAEVEEQVKPAKAGLTQEQQEAKEKAKAERIAKRAEEMQKAKEKTETAKTRYTQSIEKAINEDTVEKDKKGIAEKDKHFKAGTIESALNAIQKDERGQIGTMAKQLNKLLKDLNLTTKASIVFGTVKKADGQFDPKNNRITLNGENGSYNGERNLAETVVHEVMHYLTDHVIANRKAYLESIKDPAERKQVRDALNRLDNNYKLVKSKFGSKYKIGTMKEFIAEMYSNPALQSDVAMLPSTKPYQGNFFQTIVHNIATALGFTRSGQDEAVQFRQIVEDIASIVSLPGTAKKGFRGTEISYLKQAGPVDNGSILPSKDKGSITEEQQPKNLSYFHKLLFTRQGWRRTAEAIQNDRYEVKHWQDVLDLANKIYYDGKDIMNNVYGQLARAPAQGMNLYRALIEGTYQKLDKAIYDLSKATGFNIKDTLELVHNTAVGMHDYERRLVKYLRIVPLDNTKKDFNYEGKNITAADFRKIAFDKLKNNKTTEAQARQLRAELNAIVFTKNAKGELKPNKKYVNELGESPRQTTNKKTKQLNGVAINLDHPTYDVSLLSYKEAKQRMAEYHAFPHKALIDAALQQIKNLHNTTTELNKMANYWSKPVSNHVAFYGWDHYVPLTGYHTEEDESLNFDSKRMGSELQDKAYSFEGRTSESNNVVLQSMTDAVRSAMRAGRKDLTQSIKNASAYDKKLNPKGQGILPTAKVIAHLDFADRTSDEVLNKLPKENTIFHYDENGGIDVIEISDKRLRESIRRSFKDTNPLVSMANNITSRLGMMHTRYNFNFAPLNFVRDALTNAWAIGAELGPLQSAKYIADIATRVTTQNSLGKALKVAALYESKDYKQIEALAKNDPVIKDMYDFVEKGGMVDYLQGLSLKSNFQRLQQDLGRSGMLRNVAQLNRFVDIWTDMFELSSRSAAYAIAKKNFEAKGMSPEAASTKAVEYAKNLANFEQVGKYGKELGAVFMFFRPSATGAVRAIEAIAPAFQSVESAIKDLPPNASETDKATFRANFAERQRNARYMATVLMGLGALAYTMASMMSGDDDLGRNKVATDDPSQWNRFARFFIPGSNNPIQLPWGFGLGSFAAAGAQLAMVGAGHQSFGGAMSNVLTQISLDSFVPIPVSRMPIQDNPALWMLDSLTPSTLRPAMEFVVNKNGLGQNIYNDANRRMGDAYLGGDNIPEIYKKIARGLFDASAGSIDWSPNSIYFLSNSYMDGPARVIESTTNGMYLASGQAEQKDAIARLKGTPLVGSFIGAVPNIDSREFSSIENQIKEKERIYTQAQLKPEVEAKYLKDHPLDPMIIDAYNYDVNGLLKELRSQANQVRLMQNLNPKERAAQLKAINQQENLVKYSLVQQYKAYGVKP